MDNRSKASSPDKTYRKKYYKKDNDSSSENKEDSKPRNNAFSRAKGKYQFQDKSFNPKKRYEKPQPGSPPWKRQPELPKIVSDLQITDGKHRGKYIRTNASPNLKMTARRIRETMFRILFRKIRAGRFLDLCAGSGMVGLEAISRGALLATFVERKARLSSLIKENVKSLEINEGHGEVFEAEAVPFLKKMAKRKRFWDVVFFNPPYDTNYDEVFKYLERGVSVKPGGVLIIEHHAEMFFPERIGVLKRWRVIVQDETAISFYSRKP